MFQVNLRGERAPPGSDSSSCERCIDVHQRNKDKIGAGEEKTLWTSRYIHWQQKSPEGSFIKCRKKSEVTAPQLYLLHRYLRLLLGRHRRKPFLRGAHTGATMIMRRVTIVTCPIRPSGGLALSTTWFRHLDRPIQRAVAAIAAEGVEPWMVESRVAFLND
jgi:hypothetical protein